MIEPLAQLPAHRVVGVLADDDFRPAGAAKGWLRRRFNRRRGRGTTGTQVMDVCGLVHRSRLLFQALNRSAK
jgi:hypothetical protein